VERAAARAWRRRPTGLTTAQCDLGTASSRTQGCTDDYSACLAADGADTAACIATLESCLEPRHRENPPGEGMCSGHDGGRPEGAGHDGRGGHRGRGPHPDAAALQACRDALDACLVATPTDLTCIDTSRACVRAAFDAAFTAACADASANCTGDASEPCTRLLERCAAGVGGTNSTCAADAN
jgi:hypothetical protein